MLKELSDLFINLGVPLGFAVSFMVVCGYGAYRWYKDLMALIQQRDSRIDQLMRDKKELIDENKLLLVIKGEYEQLKKERNVPN